MAFPIINIVLYWWHLWVIHIEKRNALLKTILIPPYLKDNLLIIGMKRRAGIWTWTLAYDERLHRVRMNWCSLALTATDWACKLLMKEKPPNALYNTDQYQRSHLISLDAFMTNWMLWMLIAQGYSIVSAEPCILLYMNRWKRKNEACAGGP